MNLGPDAPTRTYHSLGALAGTRPHRLSALQPERADEVVQAWQLDPVLRQPLNLLSVIYKLVHFDQPHVIAAMGGRSNSVSNLDRPHWVSQIHRAEESQTMSSATWWLLGPVPAERWSEASSQSVDTRSRS